MTAPLTLVIDQGTHATRALAFDEDGKVRASAFCEVGLRGHGTAEVEQDADEIVASLHAVLQKVVADSTVRRLGVGRAGLTTQRSTVVAWDRRSGEALGPVLSWQDRRVTEWLNRFSDQEDEIKQRTGLRLSPHYGAGKLRWYLDNLAAVQRAQREGYLAFGPLASFLLFHLLQGQPLLVDHVNASRTLLWNLSARDWDPWLLELFGIPEEALPQSRPICHSYGRLQAADIPLMAVNGDQNSAIYSLGRPRRGTAIVNLGTGAFILLLTGARLVRHRALLSALASSRAGEAEYLIEGTVNGAGAALEWAARQWELADRTHHLPDWLACGENPPIFINTIGGLGSPWWRPGPAPMLLGDGEPWERAVAVAESIGFMVQANLEAMDEAGLAVNRLQIGGGLARLDGLCQRLADLAQRPVYRPVETEVTARGIAWLAAGGPTYWPKPGRGRTFHPQPNQALGERYRRFREVLDKEEWGRVTPL